jgi:hypothetical protein
MVCVCISYHLLVLTILKTYVKGYAMDMEKIKVYLGLTDINDSRIDHAMTLIMGFVDRGLTGSAWRNTLAALV